jgi:hypothetical protein
MVASGDIRGVRDTVMGTPTDEWSPFVGEGRRMVSTGTVGVGGRHEHSVWEYE